MDSSPQSPKAPEETPLERAIRLAGGPTALARELRARGHDRVNSHATVNHWVLAGRAPAKYCPDIEDITGIPCEDLDPDTRWFLVRQRAQPQAGSGASVRGAAECH
jgi:DNA-binding transcriptional regulator YdaS (Cro superfamily)